MTQTPRAAVDGPGRPGRWRSAAETALPYVLSVGVALFLSAGLVAVTGNSWLRVFGALLDGAFLEPGRWGETLIVATPLLLVALGMVVGVKAGLFNIGQEGQLLVGAMAMAWVGTRLHGPGPLLLLLGLALGMAAGGGYAGIAAVMRYRRGVPEVISTLLLVFLAYQLNGFAIQTRWLLRDLGATGPSRSVATAALPESVRLPFVRLFGNEFHVGLLVALVLAVLMAWALGRTVWGFRLRLLGHSTFVARSTGVSAARSGSLALCLSGGLAGLAGAVMLAGGASGYRVGTSFAQNYGWQGLLVALLARTNQIAAIPMAVVFASLRTGSGFLAATGVDRKIVEVVQALLVLALLIPPAVQFLRRRRRAVAAAREEV